MLLLYRFREERHTGSNPVATTMSCLSHLSGFSPEFRLPTAVPDGPFRDDGPPPRATQKMVLTSIPRMEQTDGLSFVPAMLVGRPNIP